MSMDVIAPATQIYPEIRYLFSVVSKQEMGSVIRNWADSQIRKKAGFLSEEERDLIFARLEKVKILV